MTDSAESPCIKLCIIDPVHGFCAGCGRRLNDIADWTALTLDQRRTVNREAKARLAAALGSGPIKSTHLMMVSVQK